MPRVVGLRCSDCGRKFAGDSNLRRHRVISGDRYVCQTDRTLRTRGWWTDPAGIWHRPTPTQTSLLEDSGSPQGNGGTGVVSTDPRHLARRSDPLTSKVAARAIAYRTGTHKALLFDAYLDEPDGLTDEEAAARVGMQLYEATKRCADLRNDGAIVSVGVRKGRSGLERQVCRVAEQVTV